MERITEKVLGFDVDLQTFKSITEIIYNNIQNEKGMQIVTINPEMIELANKNTEFAQVIKNADLVVPDGSGIKLALKLKGIKQEQIPGIDLSKELIKICAKNNKSIALIGAKEEVIQKTVTNLKEEFNNLNISFYRNGYFNENDEEEIINSLEKQSPNLVLIALGAPKQEFFIEKCKKRLTKPIFIGVGGSFDVWAGVVERAPKIFRITGTEWIFRTLKQPQRIKRIYKTLPLFLFKVIIESLEKKK